MSRMWKDTGPDRHDLHTQEERGNPTLMKKIRKIPEAPGVYMFKDSRSKLLYIGKAKNLRKRVFSYFHGTRHHSYQIGVMVHKIRDIDYFIVGSEAEALVHEADLIRIHQPPFNIDLKGGQRYPFIAITHERFPRIYLTREIGSGGVEHYGPYTNLKMVRSTLKFITETFQIRECKSMKAGGCLKRQIGKCSAPCLGNISPDEYNELVRSVDLFLRGKRTKLMSRLDTMLKRYSGQQRFEEAARVRDAILGLKRMEGQNALSYFHSEAADIICVGKSAAREDIYGTTFLLLLNIRDGRLVGRTAFALSRYGIGAGPDPDTEESAQKDTTAVPMQEENIKGAWDPLETRAVPLETDLVVFLERYYKRNYLPPLLITPPGTSSDLMEGISRELSAVKGERVVCRIPHGTQESKLQSMASDNLRVVAARSKRPDMVGALSRVDYGIATEDVLRNLMNVLKLQRIPYGIEAIDISTQGGSHTLASVVVFNDGRPAKENYRTYTIRSKGVDDPHAIYEALRRRYGKHSPPDLILVDGGRGQLNAALRALDETGNAGTDIVGLAKRFEHVYTSWNEEPLVIDHSEPTLRLLQKIRDEAHRFANTRMGNKRDRVTGGLLEIEGVGERMEIRLLERFKSVRRLRTTSVEELMSVEGVGPILARRVHEQLNRQR